MLDKIKKLNWYGFSIVFLLCAAGATANKNVNSFLEWTMLMLIIGLPMSIVVLIIGREK